MSSNTKQLEAAAQLARARASLGEALGQIQDVSLSGLNTNHISSSLAIAVRNIFASQSAGLASPDSLTNIARAMGSLRETLMRLQDIKSNAPEIERVTRTVARTLAMLYPVSKILEQMRGVEKPLNLRPKVPEQPLNLLPKVPEKRPSPTVREERRSSRRHVIEIDIGIQSNTNFFTGFSQDISSGGLFIATYDILPIGTDLNVNFSLPPGGPVLSLDGIVRWIREYNQATPETDPGMGVKFQHLGADDRKAINQFMAINPPIFYDCE